MLKENIVGKLLETIMTERKGRIRNMQKLAEAGLDAVDVLEKNLGRGWNVNLPTQVAINNLNIPHGLV